VAPIVLLDSLEQVWRVLEKVPCEKAIAGGLALSYWGYPRSTRDIDIAVFLANDSVFKAFESQLCDSGLTPRGERFTKDLGFLRVSQWIFHVREAFLEIHVDLLLGDSEFFRNAMSRSIECELVGTAVSTIRVLSCEDLILFKAASGRLIDLADIQELKERNMAMLDQAYLADWSEKLGVSL
jgi:hypothetical protein